MAVSLSKSDFMLGKQCPFKLKYKKAGFPSNRDGDPFAAFFAKGGFMVEALAHAVLSEDPRVEFERTISHGRFHARVDAYVDRGDAIVLTEIKSASVEGDDVKQFFHKDDSGILKDHRKYLEDLTFQVMVARLAFPGRRVIGRLCAVDKRKSSSIESIYDKIHLIRDASDDKSAPRAVYRGDVETLRRDHFLAFIDADEAIEFLMPEVTSKSHELLEFLDGNLPDMVPQLDVGLCKRCEYRGPDLIPSGFEACWGTTGEESLSIDLYRAGNGKDLVSVISDKWSDGKRSISDVPESILEGGKSYGPPRRNQVRSALVNREIVESALAEVLESLRYPLHFVDFETSSIPVPFHPNLRPYEKIGFQFSVHTLGEPGATHLKHSEWLNLRDAYPNLQFLNELRGCVGDSGSIVTWSTFERSTVRNFGLQLQRRGELDADLSDWITRLIGEKGDSSSESRIVDFADLSRQYYAHPSMNGSHSIKKVLDALWGEAEHLWNHPWFAEFVIRDESGAPIDPYQSLVSRNTTGILINGHSDDDDEDDTNVNQGVAAMEAYQALLFGERRDDADYADRLRQALLNYCRLDTLAMVMVWMHWRHRLGLV